MFSRRAAVRLLPICLLLALVIGPSASSSPSSVTLAGSFQSELGCPGDWDPGCTVTDLHAVPGRQLVGGAEAGDAAADDRDPHADMTRWASAESTSSSSFTTRVSAIPFGRR